MPVPTCTLPRSQRPHNYRVPFHLLPVPLPIKRSYTEERLQEVDNVTFEGATGTDKCYIDLDFADGTTDTWRAEYKPHTDDYLAWRNCWTKQTITD